MLSATLLVVACCYSILLSLHMQNSFVQAESRFKLNISNSYCLTPTCVQNAAQIINNLNLSIDPCDDFYEFSCGGWIRRHPITDDHSSMSQFVKLRNILNLKLKKLLNIKPKPTEPIYMQQARLYYQQCLNTSFINALGSKPLIDVLKKLNGWPLLNNGSEFNSTDFDWQETQIKLRNLGFSQSYLFGIYTTVDIKDNNNYILALDQNSLGLVNKKYYVNRLDKKIVDVYSESIVESAMILNGKNRTLIEEQAEEIIKLETQIAKYHLSSEERRNISNIYNKMTIADLKKIAPYTNWTYFLSEITNTEINDTFKINVRDIKFVINMDLLLKNADKRVLANYLIWRVVFNSFESLDANWRKILMKFQRTLTGRKNEEQRWSVCIQNVLGKFGISLSALYVKAHFDEKSKYKAEEMIYNIQKEIIKMLSTLEWMDNETRKNAIEKAKKVSIYVGYSNEILNETKLLDHYAGLNTSEKNSYFENERKTRLHWINYGFKFLNEKYNKNDWKKFSTPATINAFYSSSDNSVKFPAGILQEPFYNNERPAYLNYGAIGFVIGHEFVHGFDDKGRQFDSYGNHKNWWTNDTDRKFREKSSCIIKQYNTYRVPEANLNVNGILTLGENIADNGGIRQAYIAYKKHVKRNGIEPLLPGLNFTQDQLFWISAANVWCANYRPEAIRKKMTTGVHSPSKFRIIGPIVNNQDFSKAFHCRIGTKKNPVRKCSVW